MGPAPSHCLRPDFVDINVKVVLAFVAAAIHDPIPGHNRFGQFMIKNLKQAGIAGGNGGGRRRVDDDQERKCGNV